MATSLREMADEWLVDDETAELRMSTLLPCEQTALERVLSESEGTS